MSSIAPDQIALTRIETLRWAASLGAVTAEALAVRAGIGRASARGRLLALCRRGLLDSARPLAGQPRLFTITRAGLGACDARGIEPLRLSARDAHHLIVCAMVAAVLEHGYPDHHLIGERELRRDEREHGAPLASASLTPTHIREARLHRPDLVLIPRNRNRALPIAVEVELTVKAPARLQAICRAWARSRIVAGVLYLVTESAGRALTRALDATQAQERIVVVPLSALDGPAGEARRTVATPL